MNPMHMRRAIALSREAMVTGTGGPFGAVIVRDDLVVAEGYNQVLLHTDPTAHAEVVAIRAAAQAVGDPHLTGCAIYTSCEPCPMCLGAIYWARLERIYYGNSRVDAAAAGFDDDFIYTEFAAPPDARSIPGRRVLAAEARVVLAEWKRKDDARLY